LSWPQNEEFIAKLVARVGCGGPGSGFDENLKKLLTLSNKVIGKVRIEAEVAIAEHRNLRDSDTRRVYN
jgi:hypothetical protein